MKSDLYFKNTKTWLLASTGEFLLSAEFSAEISKTYFVKNDSEAAANADSFMINMLETGKIVSSKMYGKTGDL